MSHILILSLGPIQDFIASARRCRDLWYGSWLLSDLSKATALGVANAIGREQLVFPSPESNLDKVRDSDAETSVANKIVTVVPDGHDPKEVAAAAERAMRSRLMMHANDVFKSIENNERRLHWEPYFDRKTALAQIEDLIEFFWVSAPIENQGYAKARETAESLLAQRKRTMLWTAVPWEAKFGVPKSSLDGQRESVVPEDVFDMVKRNPRLEGKLRRAYGVKKNERLCGIGFLKRMGKRHEGDTDHQFLSTPHLATMPLLQRMATVLESPKQAWDEYLAALRELGADLQQTAATHHPVLGHYDGQLLLETRLEEWFDDLAEKERLEAVSKARDALAIFFRTTQLPRPNPYFAVLLADGDNMGKAISGRDTEDQHRELSKRLDEFARHARKMVEKDHHGELIYSGGDDVLAFVPLNRMIECARKLAEDFADKLKDFVDAEGKSPTLSVGIGISHFIEPMGHALDLARKAEKLAKVKRNSLAMLVDKRSGPPVQIVGEWSSRIDEQVLEFAMLHRLDEIPDGVAFELLELETLRTGADTNDKSTLESLVNVETKRILERKRAHGGTTMVDEKVIERLLATPKQLAERLIVARIVAQAKDIAEGKLPKPKRVEDQEGT